MNDQEFQKEIQETIVKQLEEKAYDAETFDMALRNLRAGLENLLRNTQAQIDFINSILKLRVELLPIVK